MEMERRGERTCHAMDDWPTMRSRYVSGVSQAVNSQVGAATGLSTCQKLLCPPYLGKLEWSGLKTESAHLCYYDGKLPRFRQTQGPLVWRQAVDCGLDKIAGGLHVYFTTYKTHVYVSVCMTE